MDDPLLDAPIMLARPYIDGASDRTQERSRRLTAESIGSALAGDRPEAIFTLTAYCD